ncbi:MAG: dihydrolipoyl dehydrogenase [Dehalococcoidia bacterium]|nr:dihydrolipoyl dehydrogenase [Dehalococcoidia bacterium]
MYDVAIIGGGPGGYVAAIRAAQLGLRAVLFERDRMGGLCLNWGCIPSKAILKNADVVNLVREADKWGIRVKNPSFDLGAAIDRSRDVVEKVVGGVEGLMRDNGIDVVTGTASLAGKGVVVANDQRYEAKNIIIATGMRTRMLPGVEADGKVVVTSKEALLVRTPPRRAVIIGAGPIGVEFGHAWATYGTQVTLVEMLDTLVPQEEPEVGRLLKRSFEARGMTCLTGAKVESVTTNGKTAQVKVSQGAETQTLEAELVLVAIGFVPHTDPLNLQSAGVETDRGHIAIDDRMQTNVPGIYAVGDVTGKLPLAHVAMQQGVIAAEAIAGRETPLLDYVQMPRATFCQPQIGSVGYMEQQAKGAGFAVKTGRFPLTALGKAVAMGETEGFIKIVADEPTGQVLGVHMIGHDVVELLSGASLSALLEATTIELGFAVQVHPTMAEALKEAALAVEGEAIHIARKRGARAPASEGVPSR